MHACEMRATIVENGLQNLLRGRTASDLHCRLNHGPDNINNVFFLGRGQLHSQRQAHVTPGHSTAHIYMPCTNRH